MYRRYLLLVLILWCKLAISQSYKDIQAKVVQLKNEGRYNEAIGFAIQVKEAARKEYGPTSIEYANAMNNLAFLYDEIGNYALAKEDYLNSGEIYKTKLGTGSASFGTTLNNLGRMYAKMAMYDMAIKILNGSLTIRQKALGEKDPLVAQTLSSIGAIYNVKGDYTQAERYLRNALSIYKEKNGENDRSYASTLLQLAAVYMRLGNYRTAFPMVEKGMLIRKNVLGEKHPEYISSLGDMAYVYSLQDDSAKAEEYYKKAIDACRLYMGEDNLVLASLYSQLGSLYHSSNKLNTASEFYIKTIAIYKRKLGNQHPTYAGSLFNLALIYGRIGKLKEALQLQEEGLKILEKTLGEKNPEYASALSNIAVAYMDSENYEMAASYLIKSSQLILDHIKNNFGYLSEMEKLKWWESKRFYFEVTPALIVKNPSMPASIVREICSQQLQLKGFILNSGSRLLQEMRKSKDQKIVSMLDQWEINRASLARQYTLPLAARIPDTAIAKLESTIIQLEKQLNFQSSAFKANNTNQQIGFAQVRQRLKTGEAAIEFLRFEMPARTKKGIAMYAAMIILNNDSFPHFVTLCEESRLSSILDNKRQSADQFIKQFYRGGKVSAGIKPLDGRKSDSLYQLIWKPLIPYLKNVKKISIAPAGLLNRVAFNALPVDNDHYLIDQYQVLQLSSAREIAEVNDNDIDYSNSQIALYGGINFDNSEAIAAEENLNVLPDDVKNDFSNAAWKSLPGTLKEISAIDALFRTKQKQVLMMKESAATEESFKNFSGHSPSILHLATHGFSLPDYSKENGVVSSSDNQFTLSSNPLLRSGIILAGGNKAWTDKSAVTTKEDGILTAYEISNLDLSNTELVVLSACETALGDIRGTEGVFGLQRAFRLAGVKHMILSLWQVPDAETAELMKLIYQNKLSGQTTGEAFYKAQAVMRSKYSPYYWAAWVLVE